MKPGIKSTEFWLSMLATLIGGVLSSGIVTSSLVVSILGGLMSILAALGYTTLRTSLKKEEYRASQFRDTGSVRLDLPTKPA